MIEQLIIQEIDPLTLDSIFPKPGRNESCHCGSGEKYKRCCLSADEEAWSIVAQMCREAEATCALMPQSSYPDYNPEP